MKYHKPVSRGALRAKVVSSLLDAGEESGRPDLRNHLWWFLSLWLVQFTIALFESSSHSPGSLILQTSHTESQLLRIWVAKSCELECYLCLACVVFSSVNRRNYNLNCYASLKQTNNPSVFSTLYFPMSKHPAGNAKRHPDIGRFF